MSSRIAIVAHGKVLYIHTTAKARLLSNGKMEYQFGGRWIEAGPLIRQTWREEMRGGSEPSEP